MTLAQKLSFKALKLKRKILKEKLSPECIAGGWALGMFIGCAIPFGLQLIISIPLAAMMRVSKIGATIGTFITNPVTIFFVYPAQTVIVNKLLFGGSMSYDKLSDMEWSFETVRRLGSEVMASFFLGGIFLGIILTPMTYFAIKYLVISARKYQERKVIKK